MILENLKAIKRWERPSDYMGADWPEYFVFLGQHRDTITCRTMILAIFSNT